MVGGAVGVMDLLQPTVRKKMNRDLCKTGAGDNSGRSERVVGWMEVLTKFGTGRNMINRAPNLTQ